MSDPPLPVSVCVLCLNEADNLPRCLAEIGNFAECIVLDTGSTDNSAALARSLGARVESSPWLGFSETRRRHFALATQPWILWIDADEFPTPVLVTELRTLFAHGPELPHAAYRINRLMHFEGRWIRHGDWFPDWVTRLFRADAWSLEERAVHESLDITGSIGRLRETLPHHSYRDRADREKRVETYALLWAGQHHGKKRHVAPLTPYLRASWKLFRGLFLKRGFLDGRVGLWIAWSNAREVLLKYQILRRQQRAPHDGQQP